MKLCGKKIYWIKAGSILGLKPTGVEKAPDYLLKTGLSSLIALDTPVIEIPNLNHRYKLKRDKSGMLNSEALHDFSII